MAPLVQRLGFVALNTSQIQAVAADAVAMAGPRIIEERDDRVLLSSNRRRAELVLYKSPENTVRRVGLEAVNAAAIDEVCRRAVQAGVEIVSREPSLEFIERSVTIATREKHLIEVHTPVPSDQPRRYVGSGIHPRCIDHINLTAVDPTGVAWELQAVLGMEITERTLNGEVWWLRAADRRHHTLGMVRGPRSGVHHYSWDFDSFDDFRRLGDALSSQDRMIVWGPGRHGSGDNIFSYYFDPAGFMVECTTEMEIVDDEITQTRIIDAGAAIDNPRVVNLWGTPPSRVWLEHHTDFSPRPAGHTEGAGGDGLRDLPMPHASVIEIDPASKGEHACAT